jgi:hypothetical protein
VKFFSGAALVVLTSLSSALPAAGQDERDRATVDAVAAFRLVGDADGHIEPRLVMDAAGAVDLSHCAVLMVRPVIYGGDERWDAKLYQAFVRIERGDHVRWRVDGGYITPPIGIATFDARPDVNPTLLPPSVYGAALGSIEAGGPAVQLLSPMYPLGAQVSASASRWDGRVAFTDSSAARARGAFMSDAPPRAPQLTVGGGFTPTPGFRVGGAWSAGRYARASETPDGAARDARVANVEFDWSGGYGRVYGEWVRGSFERAGQRGIAHAFTITGVRTLTPRWFVASRVQSVRPPGLLHDSAEGGYVHHDYQYADPSTPYDGGYEEHGYGTSNRPGWSSEATVGIRLSPELTLRAGYIGYQPTGGIVWEHEGGISITWARRWK